MFKTAESGSQGMFLGGDPSYVQKDKELIELLGLNFKHVTVGAEPAEVARFSQQIQAAQARHLLLVDAAVPELEPQPGRGQAAAAPKGCQDDASAGGSTKKYRCAYAADRSNKLLSKEFVQSGSPAVKLLRKFQWSNADQNLVAKWIAGDKVKPEKAAERWVKANARRSTPG